MKHPQSYGTTVFLLLFGMVLSSILSGCAPGSGFRRIITHGNGLYFDKKYDDALKAYNDARLENPKSPIVENNVGNVFYKQKKYEQSEEKYRKSVDEATDLKIQERAHFNLGNALFRQDKLDQAILEYKHALELDPNDVEAKYNLEYARIKLKEKLTEQAKKQQKQNKMDKHRLPDQNKKQNKQCQNPKQSPG
jgi:Ca-activated chloride channel homolog